MQERDKLFHPFERLTGNNVHLLIQESIDWLLDGIKAYIDENPRLKKRTYMDKEWLKQSLETLTIRDDVFIITNDETLREAQYVATNFDKVSILNITDRANPKNERKVMSSGTQEHIYSLIR